MTDAFPAPMSLWRECLGLDLPRSPAPDAVEFDSSDFGPLPVTKRIQC